MRNDLEISDINRLILANQYEILSKLESNKDDADYYAKLSKHLKNGHPFFYQSYISSGILSDVLPEKTKKYVLDVLDLFSVLSFSYSRLEQSQKDEINSFVNFIGFDGNNEPDEYSFALALQDENRYESILSGDLNSHSSTENRYGSMLKIWYEMGKPNDVISFDQIKKITNALYEE